MSLPNIHWRAWDLVVGDRLREPLDVWRERAIAPERRDELAHGLVCAHHAASRLERRTTIDTLRRTHELDREHVPHVTYDAPQFPRRRHRHRDDVFLVAVRGNRVDAGGM